MAEKDYFAHKPPTDPKDTPPTRPPPIRSTTLRDSPLLQRWAERPITPPGCRAISSPHWTRFTTTAPPTPMGGLLASDLCKARVLQPWYNPPAAELLPLGAAGPGEPKRLECKKPGPDPSLVHRAARRIPQSSSSWATVSPTSCFSHNTSISTNTSACDSSAPMGGISFQRQQLKRVNTESLLTASFNKTSPLKAAMSPGMLAVDSLAGEAWSADKLPSPFDTDSEDEDEAEGAVDQGAAWNAKGGGDAARKGLARGGIPLDLAKRMNE